MPSITLPGNYPGLVDTLLKRPKVIAQMILDPNLQFLSEYLFRTETGVDSGVVEYHVAELETTYAAHGDAKVIEPMGQFPLLDVAPGPGRFVSTDKFGAAFKVSDEARDRNSMSPFNKGIPLVRNHVVRLDAVRALQAIENAVTEFSLSAPASGNWGLEGFGWNDIASAQAAAPTGVIYDTMLINKADAFLLSKAPDIKSATQYTDTRATSPIYNTVVSNLDGLLGLNVVVNDFVPVGKVYLAQRNGVRPGFIAVEKAFTVEVIPERATQHTQVNGDRRAAPGIDNPGALQVITGVNGS